MTILKRRLPLMTLLIALAFCDACANSRLDGTAKSEWVYPGSGGKLVYKTTPTGDRIMDFSTAGYMGGGVALPTVPVKLTVKPSGGADDTATIQAAINEVAAMPLKDGFRGAVLLSPGTLLKFHCAKTARFVNSTVTEAAELVTLPAMLVMTTE